jgi:hypothetical protein
MFNTEKCLMDRVVQRHGMQYVILHAQYPTALFCKSLNVHTHQNDILDVVLMD